MVINVHKTTRLPVYSPEYVSVHSIKAGADFMQRRIFFLTITTTTRMNERKKAGGLSEKLFHIQREMLTSIVKNTIGL